MRFPIFTAIAVVLLASAGPPQALAEGPRDEITAVITRYADAVTQADKAALESLFAEDAILMPPDLNSVKGRAAIISFFLRSPSRKLTRTAQSVQVSGDLACVVGTYSLSAGRASGSFVTTLKHQADGSWRIVSDIWNNGVESGLVPAR